MLSGSDSVFLAKSYCSAVSCIVGTLELFSGFIEIIIEIVFSVVDMLWKTEWLCSTKLFFVTTTLLIPNSVFKQDSEEELLLHSFSAYISE